MQPQHTVSLKVLSEAASRTEFPGSSRTMATLINLGLFSVVQP